MRWASLAKNDFSIVQVLCSSLTFLSELSGSPIEYVFRNSSFPSRNHGKSHGTRLRSPHFKLDLLERSCTHANRHVLVRKAERRAARHILHFYIEMAAESSLEPSWWEMLSNTLPADTILISDDGSEAEPSELEDGSDDEDELRPGIVQIGTSKYYVPSWTTQDAFRELYQNWYEVVHLHAPHTLLTLHRKDAIIASFDLNPRSFRPVIKETPTQIHITIHRDSDENEEQSSRELLGFIRFNRKAGTVELTNFQAGLERKNLLVGMSTKRGHDEFAGCHGEGFKLAAMVLRREGHSVRFGASEYYWNFMMRGRDRSHLVCRLSRAKVELVEKREQDFGARSARPKFKRGLTSNIWEDVTVKVGKARGDWGLSVTEEDFRSWLSVAIDLNPPSLTDVVQTEAGDLILDARFEGHIYLKGLRIAAHGTNFAFGYNLARGTIGRDRDCLKTAPEEDDMLSTIWEQAILTQGPSAVDTYIKMLHDKEGSREVVLTGQKLSKSAVQVIWARLRVLNPNTFIYPKSVPSRTPTNDQVYAPFSTHRD